ncbi:hypothetical protein SVIOM74S_04273 [Streptomyces violarus]
MTRSLRRDLRRDLYAVGAAALLVTAAVLVGRHIQDTSRTLFVDWPPLLASWAPTWAPALRRPYSWRSPPSRTAPPSWPDSPGGRCSL